MQSYVNSWYEECKPDSQLDTITFEETFRQNITQKFVNIDTANGDDVAQTAIDNAKEVIPSIQSSPYTDFYVFDNYAKQKFGIEGVSQIVLVNVRNRAVISYNGLNHKNTMYYTLDEANETYNVDYTDKNKVSSSTLDDDKLVKINSITGVRQDSNKTGKFTLDIDYKATYVDKGTVFYGIVNPSTDTVSYYNKTEENSFTVSENGLYDIYVKDSAGNESTHVRKYFSKDANSPKLTDGMIPIKWVEGTTPFTGDWVVCDKNDTDWFSYDHKLWANIMLSDGTYKASTVQVGQVVEDSALGSMFVWIPRYAYQMPENSYTANAEHTIDVTFLLGTTNMASNGSGKIFQKESANVNTMQTPIVHPAFTFGDKELEGIWVAKFEASGTNSSEQAVGNRSENSSTYVSADSTTIAKSLPNKISWREITIGDSEYYSMAIADSKKASYGITSTEVTSHLLKNSEWGAIAYLCYSKYGVVPEINKKATYKAVIGDYDLYTGQGPDGTMSGYNSIDGRKASTAGNVTGIYDMNGGSWEYVAAYYDNGNNYLNTYGKTLTAVSEDEIIYFENAKLKNEYIYLWDTYTVSDQVTVYEGTENKEIITTAILASVNNMGDKYSLARYLLTKEIYNYLPKGIGVNEISNTFSFFNSYNNGTSNTWKWYKNTGTEESPLLTLGEITTVWDSDCVSLGNSSYPFVIRGGYSGSSASAGVFSSGIDNGNGNYHLRFPLCNSFLTF